MRLPKKLAMAPMDWMPATAPAGLPSDGQALAALGAACVDDSAAAAGLHADEETVGAGAADFGCLVGAFHDGSS
jgi:hypothetical protein